MKNIVIAIDGTAASGKGTLARKLAQHYGMDYLDTGALYRYVGVMARKNAVPLDDEKAVASLTEGLAGMLTAEVLADPALRTAQAGADASVVSAYPDVRQALMDLQRNFARNAPNGAVLDGRDIGTVICPEAPVKFFVTARIDIRAQRRLQELQRSGSIVQYDTLLAEMTERDRRDSERSTAPLKPAANAIILDTSEMGIDEVMETACKIVDKSLEERIGISF